MMVNYFVPLTILAVTYARVGCELWGSRYIGEYNTQQAENVRSKRRVNDLKRVLRVVILQHSQAKIPAATKCIRDMLFMPGCEDDDGGGRDLRSVLAASARLLSRV